MSNNFEKGSADETPEFEERVVNINRCSSVAKGGRTFSFSALVVVGNHKGQVGFGLGKSLEVADAIRKGAQLARKNLITLPLNGGTIPHDVNAKFRGARVLMRPASKGTGLIAGGAMRAVLELGGVHDVLAKSLGSNNPVNVVRATVEAIEALESKEEILSKRGLA
ncbi:MAG: 30S ribosomal protein S5 [Lentisphaeria bacterium]|nr:30S ribosomal protein S5 [Lentisphaeria bacterium]